MIQWPKCVQNVSKIKCVQSLDISRLSLSLGGLTYFSWWCVQNVSKKCPKCPIWTNFGHILDTVRTFQITLGTCHEDVQKLSKSFGHFIPLWTLFGQVLDKFWTHYKVGHMLDTFWTCFGHLSTLWTHFGHFYVQNVSVPTSFTSPHFLTHPAAL